MRVKICGITSAEDAIRVAEFGADAIGLNFYPKSPRFVSFEKARMILDVLPPFVEPVGLFVNESPSAIIEQIIHLPIRTIQLHADQPEIVLPKQCQWIPAFAVKDPTSLEKIDKYLEACERNGNKPQAILVDAHVAGQYGGTGKQAPWALLADYRPSVPMILAGGLTPDNVAEAIRTVHPYAVDVASGVECAPGVKDMERVLTFIEEGLNALE